MLKLPALINIEVAICILKIFISPLFTDSTKTQILTKHILIKSSL